MPTNWTEKDVMEHARELKSPFESLQPQRRLPNPEQVEQAIRARGKGGGRLRLPPRQGVPG